MSFKALKLAASATLLAGSSVAIAIPFGSFDARSMAMGGAGVAVGNAATAPLFNPALLSVTKDEDEFALILPTVGARVSDPDNLQDSFDKFQTGNYVDNLQTAVNTFNTTPNTTNATNVVNKLNDVSTQLTTLSNKPITADVGIATVVAIPSKKYGAAFYASGAVTAGGLFQYNDKTTLDNLATDVNLCAVAADTAACGRVNAFNTNQLTSGIHFKGVKLVETGLALSREVQIYNHNVSLGITPKIVKAQLFDITAKANESNQSNSEANNSAEYSFFNFDLGAAKNYNNGWRSGFVIKNVIPQNLDFKYMQIATGESLKLTPQARIGVSHATSWSTAALDVDLTRNDPAGFEKATQYIALGGELNAWDWAQLRAGYRIDMVDSARNVTSVGLGLAAFGVVHIDLAVAGNATETGASFQLGVHF